MPREATAIFAKVMCDLCDLACFVRELTAAEVVGRIDARLDKWSGAGYV